MTHWTADESRSASRDVTDDAPDHADYCDGDPDRCRVCRNHARRTR